MCNNWVFSQAQAHGTHKAALSRVCFLLCMSLKEEIPTQMYPQVTEAAYDCRSAIQHQCSHRQKEEGN